MENKKHRKRSQAKYRSACEAGDDKGDEEPVWQLQIRLESIKSTSLHRPSLLAFFASSGESRPNWSRRLWSFFPIGFFPVWPSLSSLLFCQQSTRRLLRRRRREQARWQATWWQARQAAAVGEGQSQTWAELTTRSSRFLWLLLSSLLFSSLLFSSLLFSSLLLSSPLFSCLPTPPSTHTHSLIFAQMAREGVPLRAALLRCAARTDAPHCAALLSSAELRELRPPALLLLRAGRLAARHAGARSVPELAEFVR